VSTTDVYWNSTRKKWSLRRQGRVAAHATSLALRGCTFHIQPGAQARVRSSGKKEVHAWIRGEVVADHQHLIRVLDGNEIIYNPVTCDSFLLITHRDGQEVRRSPILKAAWVIFFPNGKVRTAQVHNTAKERV